MANQIVRSDAINFIRELPENSVDLLITDPPYFMPTTTSSSKVGNPYKRTLADLSILGGYLNFFFEALDIVLKPTGTAYMFCDAKSYPLIFGAMFPYFKHVRIIVWDRMISYLGYTWRRQHELIAWGERDDAFRVPTGDGDIIKCRAIRQKERLHPSQKPLDLIRKLISKHDDASLVLDPFCGCGTIGLAAKLEGRDYWLCDIDGQWVQVAEEYIRLGANNDALKEIK